MSTASTTSNRTLSHLRKREEAALAQLEGEHADALARWGALGPTISEALRLVAGTARGWANADQKYEVSLKLMEAEMGEKAAADLETSEGAPTVTARPIGELLDQLESAIDQLVVQFPAECRAAGLSGRLESIKTPEVEPTPPPPA